MTMMIDDHVSNSLLIPCTVIALIRSILMEIPRDP